MRARMGPFTLREVALSGSRSTPQVETRCASLLPKAACSKAAFVPAASSSRVVRCGDAALIRRKSLAKLRREVEPVEQHTLARFLTHWQGCCCHAAAAAISMPARCDRKPAGRAAARIAARTFHSACAHRGLSRPAGLDTLIAAGEVAWAGVEPIGERDGRIALFLADKLPLLAQQRPNAEPMTEREEKLLAALESDRRQLLRSAA
jgi:ATP-dependent Lhr-like helicase